MNRYARRMRLAIAIAALFVGTTGCASVAPAAHPDTVAKTAADLQAKADHHAEMAAWYRARAAEGGKHAIQWFTMANHCDREAHRYQVAAAAAAGAEPTYSR